MDARVVPIAFLVGVAGDFATQVLPHGDGLMQYFTQHGRIESLLIAGGVMAGVFSLFLLTGLKLTILSAVILGVVMDLTGRFGAIPSLREFYSTTGILMTIIVTGVIPCVLVWALQELGVKIGFIAGDEK